MLRPIVLVEIANGVPGCKIWLKRTVTRSTDGPMCRSRRQQLFTVAFGNEENALAGLWNPEVRAVQTTHELSIGDTVPPINLVKSGLEQPEAFVFPFEHEPLDVLNEEYPWKERVDEVEVASEGICTRICKTPCASI